MLIDCDVHVGYETIQDLVDYLDAPTREIVLHSGVNGLGLPTYPWYHPTGWIRNDTYDREAVQQGAQLPGVSRERLEAQLLNAFDIAAAIVTPDEAACFSVLPNANLGARLATAYNDWLTISG
jgi:hypothetical protein